MKNVIFLCLMLLPAATAFAGPDVMKVMTLNVGHARADGQSQLLQSVDQARMHLWRIANVLRRESPHIAAFQEIDRNSFWNGRFDHTEFLADQADYPHFFSGSHMQATQLDYGTALVARVSLKDQTSIRFAQPFARPSKGFVLSTANWPGSEVEVDVVSVHLDFLTHSQRQQEARKLIETLLTRENPRIVMGDLNTEYGDSNLIAMLEQQLSVRAWRPEHEDAAAVTFPRLQKRLDWVLVSDQIEIVNHQVLQDALSDHRAVIAELRLIDS